MNDSFRKFARSLTSPCEHGLAVAPDDQADLPQVTRAIYVGGTGDVALRLIGGSTVTLRSVTGGTLLPVRAVRILAEGTTATDIVGLW